ncbi:phosphate ABC transporter, permease protein PstA [Luminiphilus syltensis NOR5-1B]|uniref:Phosphate transport system permease protein PstA n=1 Tax=Luminiphilus syltensis NOR5-1B TaxID=565045 RepID=B8KRT3_9GAMM|nr:phosphate ABC transporter permease PstA [Luminiphilus syltensis]EED34312.1 phosphate ABC transporter, permease protein PstA [Luminiphilus syltensis NOR5-1B]
MAESAVLQLPASLRLSRASGALKVWWCAAMVSLALLLVVGLLGGITLTALLWFMPSGSWLSAAEWQDAGRQFSDFLFASRGDFEGVAGVYPAIVGTALLVVIMSIIVAPLGVATAIYLSEYARDTWYTQALRVAIHNLAGVPAVIYGVFGLGFFIYTMGGSVDQWLYADQLPQPTFGTPGLLWAALTLALLTLPVVIVASEEGLGRIPLDLREGSLALGATRAETLTRILLPAAMPSILTGIILAMARAAGEVAPLMLVGVVKYAPALPVSLQAPFIHLERKFMHLGYYVYDVTMYAQPSEGRLGLICATALLLVLVVSALNIVAILLRRRMLARFV